MRFSSGMLGALIVALALMGTVAAGFLTSVDKVTDTGISYSYLTDATSLFSYSSDPEYAEYSPNANYTHYADSFEGATVGSNTNFYTSGIAYTATASNLVNPYRVYEEQNSETNNITLTSSISGISGWNASNRVYGDGYLFPTIINNQVMTTVMGAIVEGAYTAPLQNIVNSSTISTLTNTHKILLGDSSPWLIYGDNIRWQDVEISDVTHAHATILRSNETACAWGPLIPRDGAYILYDSTTSQATYYNHLGTSVWTGSMTKIALVWGGTNSVTPSAVPGTVMTVETTATQPATYMDISQGVILNAEDVYWNNGYGLGSVSMLLKAPSSASTLTITGLDDSNTSLGSVSIAYGASGFPIGAWDAVLLTIDYTSATYTITGVTNLVSMTDYQVSTYSQSGSFAVSGTPTTLKLHSSSSGLWNMNVASTSVFLSASSERMKDPSVNLDSYFLNEDNLRLDFQSFAYYGDSITVNGTVFPVTSGKITVHYDGRDRSYSLTNALVTWEGGHCYLTFKNAKATIDLGEYTAKAVSLQGDWYFVASVYNGELTESHHYEFEFGEWELSQGAFILVFLGILILAAMILHVKRGLTALDMVALVLVGLVAFLLM